MDPIITLVAQQLGPLGLVALFAFTGVSGVLALWMVLRYLPKREAAHEARVTGLLEQGAQDRTTFCAELQEERKSRAAVIEMIGTRQDRMDVKLDRAQEGVNEILSRLRPRRLRLHPAPEAEGVTAGPDADPDPGDAA